MSPQVQAWVLLQLRHPALAKKYRIVCRAPDGRRNVIYTGPIHIDHMARDDSYRGHGASLGCQPDPTGYDIQGVVFGGGLLSITEDLCSRSCS